MRVMIHVTADDIALGVRCSCHNCAVARAIYRKLNDRFSVDMHCEDGNSFVDISPVDACLNDPSIEIQFSAATSLFIHCFDNGYKNLEPFSFELTLPAIFVAADAEAVSV